MKNYTIFTRTFVKAAVAALQDHDKIPPATRANLLEMGLAILAETPTASAAQAQGRPPAARFAVDWRTGGGGYECTGWRDLAERTGLSQAALRKALARGPMQRMDGDDIMTVRRLA